LNRATPAGWRAFHMAGLTTLGRRSVIRHTLRKFVALIHRLALIPYIHITQPIKKV
jgi:hypothetical protein